MTLIIDAGPLVTLADRRDPMRHAVSEILADEKGSLVLPAPVSAEVDYLLGRRWGEHARRPFLEDLAAGRFQVECLDPLDYHAVVFLDDTYRSLELGLADSSIVILAARFDTTRLLTFDERDFRTVRPLQGGTFELLPAEADAV